MDTILVSMLNARTKCSAGRAERISRLAQVNDRVVIRRNLALASGSLRLVAIVEAWDSGATAQDAKRTRGQRLGLANSGDHPAELKCLLWYSQPEGA